MVASWWRHGGVMVALVYALKPVRFNDVASECKIRSISPFSKLRTCEWEKRALPLQKRRAVAATFVRNVVNIENDQINCFSAIFKYCLA